MITRKLSPNQLAYVFFYVNAGYSCNPKTETPKQGRARCAKQLAKAERDASALGFTYEWKHDPYADNSWMDAETRAENQNAFDCICYDGSGKLAASLGGIFEPSREYRRVVEAELALEALEAIRKVA